LKAAAEAKSREQRAIRATTIFFWFFSYEKEKNEKCFGFVSYEEEKNEHFL
jgi:hypothetical protein